MRYCKKAPQWFHTGQFLVYGQKQLQNEVPGLWHDIHLELAFGLGVQFKLR